MANYPFPFQTTALKHNLGARGTISEVYFSLNTGGSSMFLPYVSRWESDLATPTDLEDWSKVWSSVAKCSFNTVTLEAAYNVLLCWYWVPTRIAHLNPPYR